MNIQSIVRMQHLYRLSNFIVTTSPHKLHTQSSKARLRRNKRSMILKHSISEHQQLFYNCGWPDAVLVTDIFVQGCYNKPDESGAVLTDHSLDKKPSQTAKNVITRPTWPAFQASRASQGKHEYDQQQRMQEKYLQYERHDNERTGEHKNGTNHEDKVITSEDQLGTASPDLMEMDVIDIGRKNSRTPKHHIKLHTESYMYGLSGVGKRSNKSKQKVLYQPKVQGDVLFGVFPVLLALEEGRRKPYCLYLKYDLVNSPKRAIQTILEKAEAVGIPIKRCNTDVLDLLSRSRPHQGVCLDAEKMTYKRFSLKESFETDCGHRPCVWLVLDSVKDPMNFGAVLRSSYYLGVDRVLTVRRNSCALSPVVSKASAGALEVMPLYVLSDLVSFLQTCSERDWCIMGAVGQNQADADPEKVISFDQAKVTRNTIIILGNEGEGLSPELYELCHHLIAIFPGKKLHHGIDSLNVSVAAGTFLTTSILEDSGDDWHQEIEGAPISKLVKDRTTVDIHEPDQLTYFWFLKLVCCHETGQDRGQEVLLAA